MFGRSNSIKSTPPTTTPRPADNGSNGNNAPSGTLGGLRVSQAQTANTPAPPGGASKPSRDWKTTPIGETTRQALSDAVSTFQAGGHRSKKTNNDNAGQANEATRQNLSAAVSDLQIGGYRTNNHDIRQTNHATRQDPFGSVSGTHTNDGQPSVAGSGEEKVRKKWRNSLKFPNMFTRGDAEFRKMDNKQLAKEARYPTFGDVNLDRIKRAKAEVNRRLERDKNDATDTVKALLEAVKKVSIEGNIERLSDICLHVSEAIDAYRGTFLELKGDVDWDSLLIEVTKGCPISNKISDSELKTLKVASTELKNYGNYAAKNVNSLPMVMASSAENSTKAGDILEIIYKAMEQ